MGGAPAVAPGLLIAERYRLESALSVDTTSQRVGRLWRAYDEVLARPVAILLVQGDDPGVPEVLAGARAAARLTHAAVVRVYDAGEAPGLAFVVTEFLSGGSLEGQLLIGPLDPANAVDLVSDLAVGVAAAHDVGLHGLLLTPSSVLFTATGAPRLVGIALADHNTRDATVAGPDGQPLAPHADKVEQARLDAIGLARLLYAALTAKWPGPPHESALPPAPYAEGHLRTPRQVRGGVAREIDDVVAQAIGDDSLLRGLPPITSPAEFAAALTPLRTSSDDAHPYGADTQPITELDLRQVRRSAGRIAGQGRWRRIAIVIGLALLAVVIAGLAFSGSSGYLRFVTGAPEPGPTTTPTPTPTTHICGRQHDHVGPRCRVRPLRQSQGSARRRGAPRCRRQSRDCVANADLPHRRSRQAQARRRVACRLRFATQGFRCSPCAGRATGHPSNCSTARATPLRQVRKR